MSVCYCGREFSEDDLTRVRCLIADNPDSSRAELSRLTCRLLAWHKRDGGLKQMSARVAMLRMQADGLITLPAPRGKRPDATIHLSARTHPGTPINQGVGTLIPLSLHRIQNKPESALWNEYIERYHYLGHKPLPGAQLRYLIDHRNRPIALSGFGAAARQTAPGIVLSAGVMNNAREISISSSTMRAF